MNQVILNKEEESCLTRHGSRVHCTKCHYKTTPQVYMSGFLIKSPPNNKTSMLNRWRNRYIILRGDKTLEYYSSYKNKKPQATLKLEDVLRIDVGMGSNKRGNIFNIVLPKHTYFFSAGSEEIMWTWVRQIKQMHSEIEVMEYETELRHSKVLKQGNKMLEYFVKQPTRNN